MAGGSFQTDITQNGSSSLNYEFQIIIFFYRRELAARDWCHIVPYKNVKTYPFFDGHESHVLVC